MKTKLFPNYLKKVGWILLILSTILLPLPFIEDIDFGNSTVKVFAIWEQGPGFFTGETIFGFYKARMDSILFTISLILWLAGALLVTFSKEKHEDEFIAGIRMESLVWATYFSVGMMLFFGLFFPYFALDGFFLLNIFSLPLFFIFRYYYFLLIAKKSLKVPAKNLFFVPYRFRKIGWVLLVPSAVLFVLVLFNRLEFVCFETKVFTIYFKGWFEADTIFGFVKTNISLQLFGILYLFGVVLAVFSKEKHEDEHIDKIRMESLRWAIFLNFFLMIICLVFFWGLAINFVILVNLFALPVIFVIRFNYTLHKTKDFILT